MLEDSQLRLPLWEFQNFTSVLNFIVTNQSVVMEIWIVFKVLCLIQNKSNGVTHTIYGTYCQSHCIVYENAAFFQINC